MTHPDQTSNRQIYYLPPSEFNSLQEANDSFDVILAALPISSRELLIPYKFNEQAKRYIQKTTEHIGKCLDHLNYQGSIMVYGIPRWLPYIAEFLYQRITFKYWVAINNPHSITHINSMPPFHIGVLIFVQNPKQFNLNRVRYPHIFCSQCGDYLADWGGKKHLRPEFGPVISDIWDDREDFIDADFNLAFHSVQRLLDLTCKPDAKVLLAMSNEKPYPETNRYSPGVVGQGSTIKIKVVPLKRPEFNPMRVMSPAKKQYKFAFNNIFVGDSVKVMSSWLVDPDARFDLIFADPPYNLEKDYGKTDDNFKDVEYIQWCDEWLSLCSDLLKPNGSLYILNLPKWSFFHATLLNKNLFFQRWIAWDALSDPRGKLMPAHYSLLWYTKHKSRFTFNQIAPIPRMDQCFRAKCIKNRSSKAPKEVISDIWYDIHRIKHKRDRDEHPCQLPIKLLERILNMSTNPGDIVLDPFMGTGTTAVVAKRMGRNYVGIDIDPNYKSIALSKLKENQKLSLLIK